MYYVAIVGGRDFEDKQRVANLIQAIKLDHPNTPLIIVSGCARGADTCARDAASSLGFNYIDIPALWHAHGRLAGFIRNKIIVDIAHEVHAFWDGSSRGTGHSIEFAKSTNTPVHIHSY